MSLYIHTIRERDREREWMNQIFPGISDFTQRASDWKLVAKSLMDLFGVMSGFQLLKSWELPWSSSPCGRFGSTLSWVPWATQVSVQQFYFFLSFPLLVSVICKEKESVLEEPVYLSWMLEEWWCRWRKWWGVGRKAEWRAGVKAVKTITFLLRASYGQEVASCWVELSRGLPGATMNKIGF